MTNTSAKGVLNLDDLFGMAKPVVVVFQGRRYELKRPEALTPPEFNKWMKLQDSMTFPGETEEEIAANWTDELGEQVERLVDDVLALLNPELAALSLQFMAKVRIMEFYSGEVFPSQVEASKKLLQDKADSGNSTGASRTQG